MSTSTTPAGVRTTGQLERRLLDGTALYSVMAALFLTLLLEALDQTIAGIAMPQVIASLQGFEHYTWVFTAYIVASTTMVPIVGKLSDQFGRKWFLVIGVLIFLVGSGLSGASQSMTQLIVFRGLQGLGAGIGIALAFTVVGDIFPPAERPKWQALLGGVYGISNVIGPTVGGWLTDHGPLVGTLITDTSRWRWVFFINLPLGIIAVLALLVFLPAHLSSSSRVHRGWAAIRRIDFLGAALAAAATICLLLGLTEGNNNGWTSPSVIATLVAAVVLYGAFVVAERSAVEPILPLSLFRNPVFTASATLSLLQMMALLGMVLYLPFYFQGVLQISPTSAGMAITPQSVASVIGASLAGIIVARIKRYQILAVLGGFGMIAGAFLMSGMNESTGLGMAIAFTIIAGLGLGPFFSVTTLAAQNALPRASLGVGTAAVRYLGQIGAALGTAIVGTIVNSSLTASLASTIPAEAVQKIPAEGLKLATNPQVLINPVYHDTVVQSLGATTPPGLLDQVFTAVQHSLTTAIQHGFLAVLVFCVILTVGTFFLKDIPMYAVTDEKSAPNANPADSEVVA